MMSLELSGKGMHAHCYTASLKRGKTPMHRVSHFCWFWKNTWTDPGFWKQNCYQNKWLGTLLRSSSRTARTTKTNASIYFPCLNSEKSHDSYADDLIYLHHKKCNIRFMRYILLIVFLQVCTIFPMPLIYSKCNRKGSKCCQFREWQKSSKWLLETFPARKGHC